jgi:hypothetical protein
MNQGSLMEKFEALMRKHRGGAEAVLTPPLHTERQAPSPDTWLPVLTEVVQRGSPPPAVENQPSSDTTMPGEETVAAGEDLDAPISAPVFETPNSMEAFPEPATVLESPLPQKAIAEVDTETQDAQIAASLVDELAPKIAGLMQEQVAEELRKSLNQSMANLMANLDASVEEIVRRAVEEKLAGKDKKSS